MNKLNQEIMAIQNQITIYKKTLKNTTDQTEKAILQEKIELANQILKDKLGKLNDIR